MRGKQQVTKHQNHHRHQSSRRFPTTAGRTEWVPLAISLLLLVLVDLTVLAARVSLMLHPCETKRDACVALSVLTVLGLAPPATVSTNHFHRPGRGE